MKSFKQYTTESSLGYGKFQRLKTKKGKEISARLKAMQKRNTVKIAQARTRASQSRTLRTQAQQRRKENALEKQGQAMRRRTDSVAFPTNPISNVDLDRAIDLEINNRAAMSSATPLQRRKR